MSKNLIAYFSRKGFNYSKGQIVFLETGNTDVIAELLCRRGGVSFLPRYVVQPRLETGSLVCLDVDCPKVQMWSQLVYHKNKWVTPQMRTFIGRLQQAVAP